MHERPLSKVKVRAFLKKVWKRGGACSVCGDNAWEVQGEEYQLINSQATRELTVCPVLCATCGNTLLIASHVIRQAMS